MIFLTTVHVNYLRFISLHLTNYYMLMTLSFYLKQAWDFKTASTNYNSTTADGNLQWTPKNESHDNCKETATASSFTFNGNVIETCNSYPYLGSLISNNGQLKLNISELGESASRAIYILLGTVNKFSSGNVTILLDLFDKMILLICTYNCEV